MYALLVLAVTAVPTQPLEAGLQLSYSGSLAPVKDDGTPGTKSFELTYVLLSSGDDADAGWTLTESGRGEFNWLDQFGRMSARDAGESGPALLFERPEGRTAVPLFAPVFAVPVPLAAEATWQVGNLEHRVAGEATLADRRCWRIEVRSPYGFKRMLWVERESNIVVAGRETVFIGQGEEYTLAWELTGSTALEPEKLDQTAKALEAWIELRNELRWTPRNLRPELNESQLATLKARLPEVAKQDAGPLAAIAAAAQRDAQGQRNRAGAVSALRDLALGKPLGELDLADLSGRRVNAAQLAGKVVVLHLWEYRDTPLEEPYGQTGYLDFVARQRAGEGVVVLGVNIDPRLADEGSRRTAINSARKLQQFMNLSYPVLLDEGKLLKRLGDPRPAGGKLPLFVVVGKDGKIAEYRAGLYDVKANEGLSELDAVLGKALAAP